MRCSCDHCTDCQVVAVVKEVGSTARLALEVLRNGGSRQGQWAQDGCSLPPRSVEMKKRVPSVLELLMKELPGAAGTGGACSAGAEVPAGSTCAGIGKAHDTCGLGQGLGSVGIHAEAEPVVLGTVGGAPGASGLSTPPTRVGGRYCDTTPPKVPAFPTTCKGSVMAQVGVLEEVIRGGSGKVAGDSEVFGARGGLAVVDTTGRQSGHDLVAVEGRSGGMPRPPEHLSCKAGGCLDASGGIDEHDTMSGCKSSAGGCNIDSGAGVGGTVAIGGVGFDGIAVDSIGSAEVATLVNLVVGDPIEVEEKTGGLPRPPEGSGDQTGGSGDVGGGTGEHDRKDGGKPGTLIGSGAGAGGCTLAGGRTVPTAGDMASTQGAQVSEITGGLGADEPGTVVEAEARTGGLPRPPEDTGGESVVGHGGAVEHGTKVGCNTGAGADAKGATCGDSVRKWADSEDTDEHGEVGGCKSVAAGGSLNCGASTRLAGEGSDVSGGNSSRAGVRRHPPRGKGKAGTGRSVQELIMELTEKHYLSPSFGVEELDTARAKLTPLIGKRKKSREDIGCIRGWQEVLERLRMLESFECAVGLG